MISFIRICGYFTFFDIRTENILQMLSVTFVSSLKCCLLQKLRACNIVMPLWQEIHQGDCFLLSSQWQKHEELLIKVVSIEILKMTWKENLHGTSPPKLTPGVATFLAPWLKVEGSAVILKRHLEKGPWLSH